LAKWDCARGLDLRIQVGLRAAQPAGRGGRLASQRRQRHASHADALLLLAELTAPGVEAQHFDVNEDRLALERAPQHRLAATATPRHRRCRLQQPLLRRRATQEALVNLHASNLFTLSTLVHFSKLTSSVSILQKCVFYKFFNVCILQTHSFFKNNNIFQQNNFSEIKREI